MKYFPSAWCCGIASIKTWSQWMLPLGRFTTGAKRQRSACLTYLMMLTRSAYVLVAILSVLAAMWTVYWTVRGKINAKLLKINDCAFNIWEADVLPLNYSRHQFMHDYKPNCIIDCNGCNFHCDDSRRTSRSGRAVVAVSFCLISARVERAMAAASLPPKSSPIGE
jgi:hypothetical protein